MLGNNNDQNKNVLVILDGHGYSKNVENITIMNCKVKFLADEGGSLNSNDYDNFLINIFKSGINFDDISFQQIKEIDEHYLLPLYGSQRKNSQNLYKAINISENNNYYPNKRMETVEFNGRILQIYYEFTNYFGEMMIVLFRIIGVDTHIKLSELDELIPNLVCLINENKIENNTIKLVWGACRNI